MDTLLIKKYPVSYEEFIEKISDKVDSSFQEFLKTIQNLEAEIKDLCNNHERISFSNGMSLHTKLKILLPDLATFDAQRVDDLKQFSSEDYLDDKFFDIELSCELPTLTQIRALKNGIKEKKYYDPFFICDCDDSRFKNHFGMKVAYNPYSNVTTLDPSNKPFVLPIVNLNYSNARELILDYLLPYGIFPKELTEKSFQCLTDLHVLYQNNPKCLWIDEENKLRFWEKKAMLKFLLSEEGQKLAKSLHSQFTQILGNYSETKNIEEIAVDLTEALLNCEKIRADIDPYEARLLTDPNRGHWDLWSDQNDSEYTVEFAEAMVARNPACDVNENGVIAIDFGTKSTIVVYQADIEHSLPMGIGDGNLSKEPTPKRYENPTVMHFVDLENFLENYRSKTGRPNTKWNDLTISHTAMDQFSNSKSEEYYEYLHQIKQWAGQREKQFRIQSHDGKTHVLPAFLDLDEEAWNPIELYAYYIGLYINNMRKGHGIFLDYYLSFPVTYETKIREKIIRSFEKGLKKSLPSSILQNEEIMKRFHVNGNISEPAAYAVCALQEYGFEPEEDEEVFYGIFDFGGGTTDFDFGLWKQSSKRRYDYSIENFGAGGDEYLGGENLLEMLAFEVFKENQNLMREKGYTFRLAPKCTEFLGSDSLLADSQEAEKNMHNLMEKIRPYWEIAYELPNGSKKNGTYIDKLVSHIIIASEKHSCASDIQNQIEKIMFERKILEEDDKSIYNALTGLAQRYGIDIEDGNEDLIQFTLTLFDKNGEDHPNEILSFRRSRLNEIIETRIREGVNNFFSALLLSYQNGRVKKPTTVNIFLAGNSCKSPVVKRVFEETIQEREREIKAKYHIKEDIERMFEIFPPLGTEEAYEKMESRGLTYRRDDFEKPTGKTGVAFGLIQCREGGAIERITHLGIQDEIPFQYFIGWRSRKKFVLFKDGEKLTTYKGKPDYHQWYKFIEADASMFDLYYTTLPECVNGELTVDGNAAVKRLRCEIDVVDPEAFVYIRAIDPHTLEYAVSKDPNVESSKLGIIVRKEL